MFRINCADDRNKQQQWIATTTRIQLNVGRRVRIRIQMTMMMMAYSDFQNRGTENFKFTGYMCSTCTYRLSRALNFAYDTVGPAKRDEESFLVQYGRKTKQFRLSIPEIAKEVVWWCGDPIKELMYSRIKHMIARSSRSIK